jgi:hypothetical protein
MCEVNRFHACAQLTLSSAGAWTFIACTFKNQQCLNPKEARTKRCSRTAVLKSCAARASAPFADLKTCAKGEASEAWERAGGLASWDRALRGETVGTTEWVRLDGVLVGPRQMVRVELRASARLRRARASPWRPPPSSDEGGWRTGRADIRPRRPAGVVGTRAAGHLHRGRPEAAAAAQAAAAA